MYDLDFTFAADSQMWFGDLLRPSLRIGRHVAALRGQVGPP